MLLKGPMTHVFPTPQRLGFPVGADDKSAILSARPCQSKCTG